MSLVTVSEKKGGRVYQRKFDHELAQKMRSEGETYDAIGSKLGVSATSVARVCDPAVRARLDAQTRKWMRDARVPCRGGCGALVWTNVKDRSGLCPACYAAARTAGDEREDALRCTRCCEWRADDEFRVVKNRKTRRGRASRCRGCESAAKRDYRLRNGEREREYDRRRRGGQEKMVNYRVVRQVDGGWENLAENVAAGTPLGAIELAAKGPGTYAAFAEKNIMDVAPVTKLRAVSRRSKIGVDSE